jgi:c-di-GMP-binding flagellar brake protein YcgR
MDWAFRFGILLPTMASDNTTPQPSGRERREYYRITVTLPICLQQETTETEGPLVERAVNISAGGIGITLNQVFEANAILSCTLLLPGEVLFKSYLEVLRVDPIPYPLNTYRLHGRFIRMATADRELLTRHIIQFQREHLNKHYSA